MIVWMDEGLQEPDRPLAVAGQTIFKRAGMDRSVTPCEPYAEKGTDRWDTTGDRSRADDHIHPETL